VNDLSTDSEMTKVDRRLQLGKPGLETVVCNTEYVPVLPISHHDKTVRELIGLIQESPGELRIGKYQNIRPQPDTVTNP
jgi:hypothetical protein